MKALITGSEGFVGRHLSEELLNNNYEVIKCSLLPADGFVQLDILNKEQLVETIKKYQPDIIFNIAGQADVGLSWKKPQLTFELNVIGPINILEAVKEVNKDIKVILVGSSDEYGQLGEKGIDVTEDLTLKPMTPYAISKVSQEQLGHIYNKAYDMNICLARCFTLSGPFQNKGFVITDFASGIAEIEKGLKEYLSVGNLESARDFTHVKDAARAYRLIGEKGKKDEVYNISTGKTYKTQEVLDRLISMSDSEIIVKQDPNRMRPSDTPVICGNHNKLTEDTGWNPIYTIDDILKDVLNYWREIV